MFDNKVEAYSLPVVCVNETALKQSLILFMCNPDANVNPIEHEVFELGEYDTQTGTFKLHDGPKHMYNLRTLQPKNKIDLASATAEDIEKLRNELSEPEKETANNG